MLCIAPCEKGNAIVEDAIGYLKAESGTCLLQHVWFVGSANA